MTVSQDPAPTFAAVTSGHTPGPWKYERGQRFHAALWVVTAEGMAADTPLARLQDFDDASEPDARLIAAAPELLAALTEALPMLKGHQETPAKKARYERAVAAIAKAIDQ